MAHPFDDVIAHLEAGGQARTGWLIHAQFASGAMRMWGGRGTVVSGGYEWTGASGTVEIKDFSIEHGFIASKIDIELSGVDTVFVSKAHASKTEVQGRPIAIYLQAFGEDWQPLGEPLAVWSGIMDVMKFTGSYEGAKIALTCETPFSTRNRPRGSYYTHADQQIRSSGDLGLEFISVLEDKNVDQPVSAAQ